MNAACTQPQRRKQPVERRDRPAADQRQRPGKPSLDRDKSTDQIRRNLDCIGMGSEIQEDLVDVKEQLDSPSPYSPNKPRLTVPPTRCNPIATLRVRHQTRSP